MQGEYDTAPNQDNFSLAEFKTLGRNGYWHSHSFKPSECSKELESIP
jgi:hypothetical protein